MEDIPTAQLLLTSKPKIVFIGTPDFAADILQYIHKEGLADIAAVWSKPAKPKGRGRKAQESKIHTFCRKNEIKLITPGSINNADSISTLKELAVDFAFIVAYGEIISDTFYTLPNHGTFNLHFSILPSLRGASPVQSAILNGEETTGLTIQRISKKMDEGDISKTISFDIKEMNVSQVFKRCTEKAFVLCKSFFKEYPDSVTNLTPQDHALATYCSKLTKESGLVSSDTSVYTLQHMLRALHPWPGVFFYIDDIKYTVMGLGDITTKESNTKIQLHKIGKKELLLSLKDGTIQINRIKQQSKKEMDSFSFLNGTNLCFPADIG